MKTEKSPQTNALYGMFLQDLAKIRKRHPRSIGKKYYHFDFTIDPDQGFCLRIEPDDFPKNIRKEIIRIFDDRLNPGKSTLKNPRLKSGVRPVAHS